jgi:HPt (histidine-containing phosphotransfer) domain-containing protein
MSGDAQQTNSARIDALPVIAGLDLALAMRRLGGNSALTRKLVQRFAQTQCNTVERIRTALAINDMDSVMRQAHTTKGLAGNIGATPLFGLTQEVERAAKSGNLQALGLAVGEMETALLALIEQISRVMPPAALDETRLEASSIDPSRLEADLRHLALLLADDDSEAIKVVDSIADRLAALGHIGKGNEIRKLIERYDFEKALLSLDEIARTIGVEFSPNRSLP